MIAQKVGTFLVDTAGPRIREDDGRIAPLNPVLGACLERQIWIFMNFVMAAFGIEISAFDLVLCHGLRSHFRKYDVLLSEQEASCLARRNF